MYVNKEIQNKLYSLAVSTASRNEACGLNEYERDLRDDIIRYFDSRGVYSNQYMPTLETIMNGCIDGVGKLCSDMMMLGTDSEHDEVQIPEQLKRLVNDLNGYAVRSRLLCGSIRHECDSCNNSPAGYVRFIERLQTMIADEESEAYLRAYESCKAYLARHDCLHVMYEDFTALAANERGMTPGRFLWHYASHMEHKGTP